MTRIHLQASGIEQGRERQIGIARFRFAAMRHAKLAIWIFAVLALFIPLATAQLTSSLNGSVTDPSGAAVSNAKITLTDAATGFQRVADSNAAGLYQFLEVPPGDYQLDANATGFAAYSVAKVTLLVKLPSTINIQFRVGSAQRSIQRHARRHRRQRPK